MSRYNPPEDISRSTILLERLGRLHPKLIDLSLERIARLLTALGEPHLRLPPVIHIAGTNGKGSVAAFLKAMFEAEGLRVHRYTSPHLVRFHERIAVAGQPISEDALVDVLTRCEQANAGEPITFFEVTNAAAFLAFAETRADVTLLEVGMGGEFDSTNIVPPPALALITPIGFDHRDFLGDTLAEIAKAKAGIIKPGARAISAAQPDEVARVLEGAARRARTGILFADRDFDVHEEHGRMIFQDARGLLDLPRPALYGRHQLDNAALAVAALRHPDLPPALRLSDKAIAAGLTHAEWPARLQRLTKGPLIDGLPPGADLWLDGAHNPLGAKALAEAMSDIGERSPRPLYLIVGMLETKDAAGFFEAFEGLARHVFTVPVGGHKSASPGKLYDIATTMGHMARPAGSLDEAMEFAADTAFGECGPLEPPRFLICGSLYLAGEVLKENE